MEGQTDRSNSRDATETWSPFPGPVYPLAILTAVRCLRLHDRRLAVGQIPGLSCPKEVCDVNS